jgi:hypothetical protein
MDFSSSARGIEQLLSFTTPYYTRFSLGGAGSSPNDHGISFSGTNVNTLEGNLVPNNLQNELQGENRRRKQKSTIKFFACPIHKDFEIHNRRPTQDCGKFNGAANLCLVVSHLRRKAHCHFLPYLIRCRDCWEFIVVQEEYENVHRQGRCQPMAQPKGSRVADSWKDLYRKIFPHSQRIPSPCKSLCRPFCEV